MARQPVQVLVLPFYRVGSDVRFAVLHRSDFDAWQGVAGGVEDSESAYEAAQRELREEPSIDRRVELVSLDSTASIPANSFKEHAIWGADTYVIPEVSFGADVTGSCVSLSGEHDEIRWLPFAEARHLLTWDSNRTALWELTQCLSETPAE